MGGHQLGSIWGHGAYLTPDWSADWLHRELVFILDRWATLDHGAVYADITSEQQAALRERLRTRRSATTGSIEANGELGGQRRPRRRDPRQSDLLRGPVRRLRREMNTLREQYAMPENPIPDAGAARRR